MSSQDAVQIRSAEPGDARNIAEISVRTFFETFAAYNTPENMEAYLRTTFNLDRVAAELADPRAVFFLAVLNQEIVGYAKMYTGEAPACVTGPRPMELTRLYVYANQIGRGVGPALLRHCLGAAWNAGRRTVWLGVWEHNARAKAFYAKWGFQEVGSYVFTLGSDDQIDLLMELRLNENQHSIPPGVAALG